MSASSTVIANMALKHLKVAKEIALLETEQSAEAIACRAFYETARQTALRHYPWPFARKFQTLALIEVDPNNEWGNCYRYPSDCLLFRRILSGSRTDTRESRVPFILGSDASGQVIYTDLEEAVGEYTFLNSTEQTYPADFALALSYLLASLIAPSITGGDPFKLGERAMQLSQAYLSRAAANSFNEQTPDEQQPESEFILARE